MKTRREFLTLSAAASLGLGMSLKAEAASTPNPKFGVQLYTVRNQLRTDPKSTLAAIRQMGYVSAEAFVAEYSMTAKELGALIVDSGLTLPSAHFGYADFGTRFDYAKDLGVQYMVCSSVPRPKTTSADGFKQAADQYNAWGEQAKKIGMSFGFHNHNIEFQSFNGATGIDILLRNTDPDLVHWQMDVYWVTQAGFDPVILMNRYRHRLQTLHVKDRKAGAQPSLTTNDRQNFTEVGRGTLNWKGIAKAARAARIPYVFVEQDWTLGNPLDSLKISYSNLQRIFP